MGPSYTKTIAIKTQLNKMVVSTHSQQLPR